MKKYFISLYAMLAFIAVSRQSAAQYPVIPPAMEDSANAAMKKIQSLSDEAFAKALPVIEADEKKRKAFYSLGGKSN